MSSDIVSDTFEKAFQDVQGLVSDFHNNKAHYMAPAYQEQEARQDFIDKFWTALGWDVKHDVQKNPYAQEVKVERGITMIEGRKRADYAFYLDPDFQNPRFFVEAKKPSVEIANKDSYFQTIRYGWNGGTPLSILTDFEQFHVLDCRARPDIDTSLSRAVQKYNYMDYVDRDKFGAIYWLFSREAVAAGALDAYIAQMPKPGGKTLQRGLFHAGYQSIDESFLRELDEYRGVLARAFHASNPGLDSETLTEATQRVLDRLVFMRFLEDKGIEPEPMIAQFADKGTAWNGFIVASRRLDRVYNGNVFKAHFIDSAKFLAPDAVFGQICSDLSSEQSPYLFSLIPIPILGSIYERFLGKVIVVDGGMAKVEEKPEVRKAGGVYYTPDYVVRYIVDHTVGVQIEGKSPAEITTLRFADIACGSGSFLLGVYDALLRYHTAYYNAKAKGRTQEAQKAGCERREGIWHLTLNQKRDILENNVWGVDIDAQAVEVAQLSLYLKMLEEETLGTTRDQLTLTGTVLPTLTKNVVFGNSLIGTDILEGRLFEPTEERKLNPLDFKTAFPHIMKNGGFDTIVGNPPYVRIQGFPRNQLNYFAQNFQAATGSYDLYVNFIERGYKLLKSGGRFGQILPNKFLKTDYGIGIRGLITSEKALAELVDFGAEQVFAATTYTCLLFLSKRPNETFHYMRASASPEGLTAPTSVEKKGKLLSEKPWLFTSDGGNGLLQKLAQNTVRLLDLPADMSRGSSTGDDKVFVVDEGLDIEPGILRTPIFATNFNRFRFGPLGNSKVVFPYVVTSTSARLYQEHEVQTSFPKAYSYLLSQQDALKKRKDYKKWFGFSAPRNLSLHDRAQIIVPLLANKGLFSLIPSETQGELCPMASGGFTITLRMGAEVQPQYVLGLINSKLLFWNLQHTSNVFRGGWITCTKQYLGELPIRRINFSDPNDKAQHDTMVSLVEQMLKAKKQRADALTDREIDYWQRRCDGLDRQIDELVYSLYRLTDDEIALVEGTQTENAA